MLEFLVKEMLSRGGKPMKGYVIGVAVFGRDEGYDPQVDPVVRMEARRLRRDLDSYYGLAGRDNPLRISIPKGQYVPEILRNEPNAGPAEAPSTAVAPGGAATMSDGAEAVPTRSLVRWGVVAAALVGIVVLAGLIYTRISNDPQQADRELSPQQPALVVLPFAALSTSEDDFFLGAGIAGQIVRELRQFADLRLYASPAQSLDNSTEGPVKLGKELGVNYVVSGDVRSEGASIQITSRLIDALTGEIIWTETYERESTPHALLAVQAEIATSISSTLGQPYGIIRSNMIKGLPDSSTPNMTSYECVLRGYWYRRTFSRELLGPTLACLEETVRRDPEYAEAWALLGWLYLDSARFAWVPDNEIELFYQKALSAAAQGVELDSTSVLSLKALSSINHYLGNYDEGEQYARKALAINPNDPDTLAQLGWRLAVRGKFDQGIPYLERAIERSVNPPVWYHHLIAVDHYMQGRYSEMRAAAKLGIHDSTGLGWSFLAIANGALGNIKAAHEALAEMAKLSPQLARNPAAAYRRHGATDEIVNALVGGLHKAGLKDIPIGNLDPVAARGSQTNTEPEEINR